MRWTLVACLEGSIRVLLLTGCNQAGNVGHVREQVGVALVRNLPHARIVVVPALTPFAAQHSRILDTLKMLRLACHPLCMLHVSQAQALLAQPEVQPRQKAARNAPGVGASACHDQLGAVQLRGLLQHVVVDDASLFV